jgi:hypothetical protein
MPDSNESFMDGNLGLGMAIPEEATTAKLGPLPSLMGSNRTERDEVPCRCCAQSRTLQEASAAWHGSPASIQLHSFECCSCSSSIISACLPSRCLFPVR